MANAILTKSGTVNALTITLGTLATATARQSTMVSNTTAHYGAALIYVRIKSGATGPTAGSVYEVYLLRGDDPASSTYRTDAAGASDAAITIENAALLGSIVLTNTANKNFYGDFSTEHLGPLGKEWGIAIKNVSGQTTSTTDTDHYVKYVGVYPEAQ